MPRKSNQRELSAKPEPTTFKVEIDGRTVAMIPGIGATRQFVKYLTVKYDIYVESSIEGWRSIKLQ